MQSWKHAISMIVLGTGLVISISAAAAPPRIEVGEPFPDIVLPAIDDGHPMSIADFRGKKIVLHVFASW